MKTKDYDWNKGPVEDEVEVTWAHILVCVLMILGMCWLASLAEVL